MPSNNTCHSSGKSVIVVDDEIELSTLFKAFLRKEGYDAISFSDPVMALEYFKKTFDKHSLIITDMRMPGMSGIELAKKIREFNNKVKIFLITAFDISEMRNNSDYKVARIDNIIQKPVHLSDLREMLNNSLKN